MYSRLPKNQPAYVKIYLENIKTICQLKRGSIDVLIKLIELVEYNTNRSKALIPSHRKNIAKSLGITTGSFANSLTDLKKMAILVDFDRRDIFTKP